MIFMEKLLAVRKEKKAKTPKFTRHASHRKKRLKDGVWRKPKGLQNKLRLRKKSRGAAVKDGYRTPVKVRGLSTSGKKQFLVRTKADLLNAEPEVHAVIIARVGDRRRVELLKEAEENGFEILNLDAKARTAKIAADASARSKKRDARVSKRKALEDAAQKKEKAAADAKAKKAAATAAKTATKTAKKTAGADETTDAKAEKKKQDKVLTKKD
jgi:large subunit ribosomal protein L32e